MEPIIKFREQIAALQVERAAIQHQTRSRAEVKATLDAWLSAAEQKGHEGLRLACEQAAAGMAFTPCHVHGNAAVFASPGAAPVSLDLAPLLLALMGKTAVSNALAVYVDHLPEGLAPKARSSRLAAIERELQKLEVAEEAAIVEAEQQGKIIMRRVDARPEIILA